MQAVVVYVTNIDYALRTLGENKIEEPVLAVSVFCVYEQICAQVHATKRKISAIPFIHRLKEKSLASANDSCHDKSV